MENLVHPSSFTRINPIFIQEIITGTPFHKVPGVDFVGWSYNTPVPAPILECDIEDEDAAAAAAYRSGEAANMRPTIFQKCWSALNSLYLPNDECDHNV